MGWHLLRGWTVLVYLFMFLPILVVVLLSFNASQFGSFPMTGLSFRWFIELAENEAILRAFRILRVLRMVSVVPSMRRVVTGLLRAIPGMGSVVLLMSLIFYVFSVMATKLFGAAHPEWFGDLGESAYTLFQVMTLESWSMGIVRPVMEQYPLSWLLFVPFILCTAFTVLNLFIGVIVSAMQQEHEQTAEADRQALHSETGYVLTEVRALRDEVRALRHELGRGDAP